MSPITTASLRATDGMGPLREYEEQRAKERFEAGERAMKTKERAERSLGMCTSDAWPIFMEWLDELRQAAVTSLLAATDIGDVRAFQAQAKIIDSIKEYPEIVKREAAEAATVASSFGYRA